MKRYSFYKKVLLVLIGSTLCAMMMDTQAQPSQTQKWNANELAREKVVNEILAGMSLEEKIGQLYVVSFSSRQTPERLAQTEKLIRKYQLGGLILMYSDLQPASDLMNRWIDLPKVPFLMTIDAEWGLAMRFDDVVMFPQQMQLGSLATPDLVYEMGLQVGEQLRRIGMQVNFAPDVDINNNPMNPVINVRSFSEDREKVTTYSAAYLKGMQDAGIAICLKHFPGHGDTSVDSHHALPLLNFDRTRLDSLELYPFRELIRTQAIDMVMLGHLEVPALDPTGTPSSLSKPIVTDLLKNELGFDGIVITDALGMKGVAEHIAPEQIPLAAFQAGVDILLMPQEVEASIKQIKKAVRRGKVERAELDERVRKVLRLKYDLGLLPLDQPRMKITKAALQAEINRPAYRQLVQEIGEETLILFEKGQQVTTANLFPVTSGKTAYVGFHPEKGEDRAYLGEAMNTYAQVDTYYLPNTATHEEFEALKKTLNSNYETVILGIHHTHRNPQRSFGLNDWQADALDAWAAENERPQLVLSFFGIPYGIMMFENNALMDAVVIAHANTDYNNRAVARLLTGQIAAKGVLPVTLESLKSEVEKADPPHEDNLMAVE
ncbi:MAG: hypothetical protein IKV28_00185 [Bacteroidales bacterium]|nr:hypothetical protein [Bacteroidales bacterium]